MAEDIGELRKEVLDERVIRRRAEDDLARALATITRLNRRCQAAEAAARANVERAGGQSLGRALANYAAGMYKREVDELRVKLAAAEVDHRRDDGRHHRGPARLRRLRAGDAGAGGGRCGGAGSGRDPAAAAEDIMTAAPKYPPEAREADAKVAEMCGFIVVRGAPDLLLLDLDDGYSLMRYEALREIVGATFGYRSEERWRSKSGGGHWHVVMHLKTRLPAAVRIGLQAALGSDGMREALALVRLANGHDEPSMLFRPGPRLLPPRRDADG